MAADVRDLVSASVEARVGILKEAAEVLRRGGLVGLPTETVYGLGCDASNGEAIARLYEAKGRPRFNPLIAHVASAAMAGREVEWSDAAERLADRFWPGPLTLVLPFLGASGSVSELARAGLDTLAVRQPRHPGALALIEAFGGPIVAPSANPSGRISPTTAQHVASDLGDRLDLILDGGPAAVGVESTIVSLVGDPALLRPGGLGAEEIEGVLGLKLARRSDDPGAPTSPGQLLRHYAPRASLRLDAQAPAPGEVYLGFGDAGASAASEHSLSRSGDLGEAAANLFGALRRLDGARVEAIAVAPIPNHGLGAAIRDRLQRAAR